MRAFFKHLPIVSLVIFCFAIVLAAAGPGSGAVGEYEPEKAFAAILEKLTGR